MLTLTAVPSRFYRGLALAVVLSVPFHVGAWLLFRALIGWAF